MTGSVRAGSRTYDTWMFDDFMGINCELDYAGNLTTYGCNAQFWN